MTSGNAGRSILLSFPFEPVIGQLDRLRRMPGLNFCRRRHDVLVWPAVIEIHAARLDSGVVMEDDRDGPSIRLAIEHMLVPLSPLQRVGPILGQRDLSRLMVARTRTIDSVLSIFVCRNVTLRLLPSGLCYKRIQILDGVHARHRDAIDLHAEAIGKIEVACCLGGSSRLLLVAGPCPFLRYRRCAHQKAAYCEHECFVHDLPPLVYFFPRSTIDRISHFVNERSYRARFEVSQVSTARPVAPGSIFTSSARDCT